MTDSIQPIITALKTCLHTAGYRYVEQYSIDSVNRIGNNVPAILIKVNSGEGIQQPVVNECTMSISLLVYLKSIYQRQEKLTIEFNKIKTAIFDSGSLSGTVCNIPSYSFDYGTDEVSSDLSTAGTSGQLTIGEITFNILYYEER